ncbi:MAG: aminodeoxychorismate/anthranilate synthase component II [Propionibacteriaceae bacterium]|jgi:anthranilate synthase component 2|nr:aminodeoxychorismate/anthranilate synthase component II [Propionibacteriaceae bacterium]
MILLIDNYDSFSHNLYQLIGTLWQQSSWSGQPDIRVIRNDECTVADIANLNPSHIVISPGHGRPDAAGVIEDVIRALGSQTPILGVCLGHQAICEAYGAQIGYAKKLMHGKQDEMFIDATTLLFHGLPTTILAARYHSLVVLESTLPKTLRVSARTLDGEVMAVAHRDYPIYGIQFHPESIMTPDGATIMANFLSM